MQIGQVLSHYRILTSLGQGGMGQVWLAEDAQLGRQVALKTLPPELARDPDLVQRFAHEAKAIAALNHPNIAQVYEFGEAEGIPWLAMEYVDGPTLSARAGDGPLPTPELLEIGIQIADALSEAHVKGIIHRDIKPGNIMLTQSGRVKVLDFGLAKVRYGWGGESPTQLVTRSITSPGQVVGTLPYMSPEQHLGREVDPRSDLFSLGAVLYWLATGRQAFNGTTPAVLCDAVLNRTPASPLELNPSLPPEFDRVLRKALEKDRDLRYQTAFDLRADLKRLQRDSESGPAPVTRPPRRSRWALGAFAALMLVAAGWWAAWRWHPHGQPPLLEALPLTALPGSESQPSFSPDGNQVAFAWNGEAEENWDIYVKVVGEATALRLTSHPATDHSPAWSPDGRYIVFLRQSDQGSAFILIPALGGLERRIAGASSDRSGLESPYAAWSPDGKTLALSDRDSPDEPAAIHFLRIDTGQRRKLTSPPPKTLGDSAPMFSPDGKQLAFLRTTSLSVQDLHLVPVTGGEPKRLTNDRRRIFGAAWDSASGKILFTSGRGGSSRLWRISPFGGQLEHITGIGEFASFLAVSPGRRRLAYTRSTVDTNVWRYELPGPRAQGQPPVRLISSTRYEQGPRYSPDGQRIVFASNRSGAWEIWLCDAEGLNPIPLTSFNGPPTGTPHWSPDGQSIVFDSRPDGNPDVFVVTLDGRAPRRLTSEPSEDVVPSWSQDGRWILFSSNRSGAHQVWKVPAEGGPASQVTRLGGFHAHDSPDSRWVYYNKSQTQPGLWRVPAQGGEETPVIEDFRAGFWGYWEVVGDGIYYLDREEVGTIGVKYYLTFLSLPSRRPRQLLQFPRRPFNSGLAISPDRHWLLFTQVDSSDTDIMLVENFR